MSLSFKKLVLFGLLTFFISTSLMAQHKPKPFYKGRYNAVKISKKKAKVVCPVFQNNKYPYQGIGFKLGDPFAITYKLYANKHLALAVDLGSTASGLYSKYYAGHFSDYTFNDTLLTTEGISYLNHKVKYDWMGEAKLLYQMDADAWVKGLQWYVGFGWQWRHTGIEYEYVVETGFNENEILHFDRQRFATGPTGAIGLEYSYFQIPVSAFIEFEIFSDIYEDPGWVRPQGGVGLRYIF